ncbi:MAG TPA: phage portal protein [Caulobacteraceae bacterium]|nr:phage portal protein [Caulobacteraceae bacterium]
MRASLGGSAPAFFPYDAADWTSQEFGDWLPWIRSPDAEYTIYRDRITARARDLYRNDGWAKGAIGGILDSTIGASYRLVAKPDYRALRSMFGGAFDAAWAKEFRGAVEARWRVFSEDDGRFCDVSQQLTMSQIFRIALGNKLVDGESLILTYWQPEYVGVGGAHFATAFQGVDPDRLSNPFEMVDTKHLRGGVEVDERGVPVAYHVRRAHQNDWYNAIESMEWDRIPRRDPDGFRRVFHDFDRDRFGQNRGVSIFAPVIGRLKMLAKYYGVELSAATVASHFGTYVSSPFDRDMVAGALDDGDREGEAWGFYQSLRDEVHERNALRIDGVAIPLLAPGEEIETVSAVRPNASFSPFTHEMLRTVAAVLGTSAEQIHRDYSDASWSSARAGIVEAEKTFVRRTTEFNHNTASPIYATWLDEPFEAGELPLPRNAPGYAEARTLYSRCRWLGAARGWVDPVAERQGEVLGLDAAFSTLEEVVARQGGDWEENLEQRGIEYARMLELGLPPPKWFGEDEAATAQQISQKPEPQ